MPLINNGALVAIVALTVFNAAALVSGRKRTITCAINYQYTNDRGEVVETKTEKQCEVCATANGTFNGFSDYLAAISDRGTWQLCFSEQQCQWRVGGLNKCKWVMKMSLQASHQVVVVSGFEGELCCCNSGDMCNSAVAHSARMQASTTTIQHRQPSSTTQPPSSTSSTGAQGFANAKTDLCRRKEVVCNSTWPYREIDGFCNNVETASLARHGTPFQQLRRLLQPQYNDGVNSPRSHSVSGARLPSARLVSSRVHRVGATSTSPYSHYLMMWGQFFNHGIAKTPRAASPSGGGLDCSRCDSPSTESPDCFPIRIPPKDPHFPSTQDGRPLCLPFGRSRNGVIDMDVSGTWTYLDMDIGMHVSGTPSVRQQLNQITSFIDASNVYGSDRCTARELRLFSGGRLRSQETPSAGTLMPGSQNQKDCGANSCFLAGDDRSNQNIGLASLHTIWMREHNRLAGLLEDLNDHWDDERIFQEARRILTASMQHITYNEFLPIVLGAVIMTENDLSPKQDGFYNGYNSSCDATLSNEFATAAFRFGHSLIQSNWHTRSADGRNGSIRLSSTFFKPAHLYHGDLMDSVPRGMAEQPAANFDTEFSKDISRYLFKNTDKSILGQDLVSRNVQRGRDHGLPPYTHYRTLFGLIIPRNFHDLRLWMRNETVAALQSVFESVHDIDLYTGLMSEIPENGVLVGPTTALILAEQFGRLRKCDRFWYENGQQANSFSPDQLLQIRKVTLAKVVCNNLRSMKGLAKVQPRIFHLPNSAGNEPIYCGRLPVFDHKYWKDSDNAGNIPCSTAKYTFNKIGKYTQRYSGSIWSPNYPNSYGRFVNCYYNILATSDKPIQLTFTHFAIENGYDYVKVFHKQGNTTLQTNMTGNLVDLPTVYSMGDMRVHFHSDRSGEHSGFSASFENGFAI